ncbi:MAG TPA: hypothetical protein VGJ32_12075 [Solirubrobacteraceae bacterium]
MRPRPNCPDARAAAVPVRRPWCVRPRDRRLLDALLLEREMFVGAVCGPEPGVWRVTLASGDAALLLDGAAVSAGDFERTAAGAMLAGVLGGPAGPDAVAALAADLGREPGGEFALSDAELRTWYVSWLVARAHAQDPQGLSRRSRRSA